MRWLLTTKESENVVWVSVLYVCSFSYTCDYWCIRLSFMFSKIFIWLCSFYVICRESDLLMKDSYLDEKQLWRSHWSNAYIKSCSFCSIVQARNARCHCLLLKIIHLCPEKLYLSILFFSIWLQPLYHRHSCSSSLECSLISYQTWKKAHKKTLRRNLSLMRHFHILRFPQDFWKNKTAFRNDRGGIYWPILKTASSSSSFAMKFMKCAPSKAFCWWSY